MITPLTFTSVDWLSYMDGIKKILSKDPIKSLDSREIKLQNPLAVVYSLQELSGNSTHEFYNLVQASFIIDTSVFTMLDLLNLTETKASKVLIKGTLALYVFYGGLADWKITVTKLLKSEDREIQQIGDSIYSLFCSAGLKTLWSDCKISKNTDIERK